MPSSGDRWIIDTLISPEAQNTLRSSHDHSNLTACHGLLMKQRVNLVFFGYRPLDRNHWLGATGSIAKSHGVKHHPHLLLPISKDLLQITVHPAKQGTAA